MQTKSATVEQAFVQSGAKIHPVPLDKRKVSGINGGSAESFRSAIACLDNSSYGPTVFRHTKAVADGLKIPVKMIHVLRGANPELGPSDPIQWQIKCREAQDNLRSILRTEHQKLDRKDQLLLTGIAGDELARWAADHDGSLMAVTTRCGLADDNANGNRTNSGLGAAAQQLLEGSSASLLLIPPEAGETATICYRRVLVPLDGSCRAESVLPFALRLARAHGAELILAHVVPRPEIVGTNTLDPEAAELLEPLLHYNEQNARTYLDRLRTRLNGDTVSIRTVVESDGDPRERLLDISDGRVADLIVISARGRGEVNNVSCGNIARYLATHAGVPLLMIRQQMENRVDRVKLSEQHNGPRMFWESAH